PARLYRDGTEIKILPDRDGHRLDVDRAREDTLAAIEQANHGSVELHALPVVSQVTAADLEPLREQTQALISGPVVIRQADHQWEIEQKTLVDALVLPQPPDHKPPELRIERITPILESIAKEVYKAPRNAVLAWDQGVHVI